MTETPEHAATMTADELLDALAEQGTGAHKLEPARAWLTGRSAHPAELVTEMEQTGTWGPGTVVKAREIMAVAGISFEPLGGHAPDTDSVVGGVGKDVCPPPPIGAVDQVSAADLEDMQAMLAESRKANDELRTRLQVVVDGLTERVLLVEQQIAPIADAAFLARVERLEQQVADVEYRLTEQGKLLANSVALLNEYADDHGKLPVVAEPTTGDDAPPPAGQ